MDSRPKVTPRRTWWEWFPENLNEFIKGAETILERHSYLLDPDIYGSIHFIAANNKNPGLISAVLQSDTQSGFPRVRVLGNYWFRLKGDGYGDNILKLVKWCQKEAIYLEASGISSIKKVAAEVPFWEPQTSPPCMISNEELVKQMKALHEFQESNKTLNI